jgi:hypothetical protein
MSVMWPQQAPLLRKALEVLGQLQESMQVMVETTCHFGRHLDNLHEMVHDLKEEAAINKQFNSKCFTSFDLIIVVPVLFHPLQRGCYSHIQISACPTFIKGLFCWTRLKAFAQVMSLFFAGLVCFPPCADKSLALSKVDRVGTFSILLKLKTHHSLFRYHFGTAISDWGLLSFCFHICNGCNICFLLTFGMSVP